MASADRPIGAGAGKDEAFDIVFRGPWVDVILRPYDPAAPPRADAIFAALRSAPPATIDRHGIERALAEHTDGAGETRIQAGQVTIPRDARGPCLILASPDRLAAYAVPTARPPDAPAATDAADPAGVPAATAEAEPAPGEPPPGEPPPAAPPLAIPAAQLREHIAAAKIVAGVLDDVVDGFGEGTPLTQITCVARGQRPLPGTNATIEYHFDPNPHLVPAQRDDGGVDYHTLLVQRFVAEGTVLATRHNAVPGVPGHDVFGSALEVAPTKDIDLKPLAGSNTAIQEDTVVAAITGRPLLTRGTIEVLPVYEVPGNLDYTVGNIDFPGDVVIRGDVRPGFSIVATGSVVVTGLVEGATITAGHDLAVRGTVGEHRTVFEVGGDLNARYLHTAEAKVAGAAHVAGEIMNCTLTAERVSTGPLGRIIGGTISARTEVDTGSLGARRESITRIAVTSREPGAVIRARRAVRPGLVLELGYARREIVDELEPASFWEVAGSIVMLKPGADEAAAAEARAAATAEADAA